MNKIHPVNDTSLKVFDELFDRFQKLDTNALLVYLIDNVDSSALPHLAEQFHVTGNEGWLQVRDNLEKRELIKSAIDVHRHKGTRYALDKIFGMFGLEGNIEEWWEYGGEPFRFTVDINFVSKGLDFELIAKLEDLINEYKNVRCHLESLKISLTNFGSLPKIKSATISGETVTIYPPAAPLIWDEFDWDEKNWSKKLKTQLNLPIFMFDSNNFDETVWAFG